MVRVAEKIVLDEADTEVLEDVADAAIHFTSHGLYHAGMALISTAFALGDPAVEVICERLAVRATHAQWQMPGCYGLTKPIWPTRSGRPVLDANAMGPYPRWAGRYIAARAAGDYIWAADLLKTCSLFQLTKNVEALLQIAALWINLAKESANETS